MYVPVYTYKKTYLVCGDVSVFTGVTDKPGYEL